MIKTLEEYEEEAREQVIKYVASPWRENITVSGLHEYAKARALRSMLNDIAKKLNEL